MARSDITKLRLQFLNSVIEKDEQEQCLEKLLFVIVLIKYPHILHNNPYHYDFYFSSSIAVIVSEGAVFQVFAFLRHLSPQRLLFTILVLLWQQV
jgi:hypothetical protein